MNRTINRLGAELVIELTKSNPEDYQKFKLMLLSHEKKCKEKRFFGESILAGRGKKTIIANCKMNCAGAKMIHKKKEAGN